MSAIGPGNRWASGNPAPTVSVIIAAYNACRTLPETLESLLGQTLKDFEAIVVDDGSTDTTAAIGAAIGDHRVRSISQPNAGVSAARNRGAADARGEFLSFLDSDDVWMPEKLACEVAALRANPDAGLAYSWTRFIDPYGKPLAGTVTATAEGWVRDQLLLGCFLSNGSSIMVRRDAFEAVGGYERTLRTAEDWDFYLRVAERYPFVCVPVLNVLYRIDLRSKSFRLGPHEEGNLRVIERAFAGATGERLKLKRVAVANLYRHLFNRALQEPITRSHALTACRFAVKLAALDPRQLPSLPALASISAKIGMRLALPSSLGNAVFTGLAGALGREPRRPFG